MLMLVLWIWAGLEFLCAGWRCCSGGNGVGGRGGAVGNGRGVVVLGLGRLGVEGGRRRYCNSSSSSSSGSNRARTISRARDRHGGTVAGAAGL